MATPPASPFQVDLPAGGTLILRTQEEVDLWDDLHDKYVKEYGLSKANDLALLGAILAQHLTIFRAQQRMTGMIPETDGQGVPTGRYKLDPNTKQADMSAAALPWPQGSE